MRVPPRSRRNWEATTCGNAGPSPPGDLWLTVSDLARRQGVTKGPMSRRVSRLEELGVLTPRMGERGVKLVNVAQFLKAVDRAAAAPSMPALEGLTSRGGLIAAADSPLDIGVVDTLAEILGRRGLSELEVDFGRIRVRLARAAGTPAPGPTAGAAPSQSECGEGDPGDAVLSPAGGTVYLRAGPEARPFIEVGSAVRQGDRILPGRGPGRF